MKHIYFAALLCMGACTSVNFHGDGNHPPKALGAITERAAAPTEWQAETFGTLAQYVGKTFKGAPKAGSSETFTDIQKWEWGLNGNTLLIRHALEDGSYGGDTHVYKDTKTGKLSYVYITSGGFHTVGEMMPTDNGWVAEEAVIGHETITRVRSTSTVDETGKWTMTSAYLTNGEWVPGHGFEYVETDAPLPALKVQ